MQTQDLQGHQLRTAIAGLEQKMREIEKDISRFEEISNKPQANGAFKGQLMKHPLLEKRRDELGTAAKRLNELYRMNETHDSRPAHRHVQMLDRMAFYAPGELGKTRRITPEGFLLCEGVAIARTGEQRYGTDEVPLEPDASGDIRVERTPEQVFSEKTMASFEGKSVTVDHPNEFVGPSNWNALTVGVTQNVRRGTGIEDDLLFADLLITAADAIAHVNQYLPELSAGYESDYEQTAPGRGVQTNIVGNHVALVTRGRAGPRCATRDHFPGEFLMKTTFADRLNRFMDAFKAKDERAMKAELESEDEESDPEMKKVKDSLREVRDELAAMKAKDADEERAEKKKAEDDEEEEKKDKEAKDALEAENAGKQVDLGKTYTGDALKEIFSRAEILCPGIQIPTGDALSGKAALPQLLTKALATADATDAGKEFIEPFLMGRDIKTLTGDALLGVFNGAAELARLRNNRAGALKGTATRDFGKAGSVTSINDANKAFWANR
jgi:hypothetical protein